MMNVNAVGIPAELFREGVFPSISLYMPTHRTYPANVQDHLRYKNLVVKILETGTEVAGKREILPCTDMMFRLLEDRDFWNHALDGLAVFASPDIFRVFLLQQPVSEDVHIAGSFYLKPLLRVFQAADRFQVLALTRTGVRMYEGDRFQLDQITMAPEVPKSVTEALGTELGKPDHPIASVGGRRNPGIRYGHSTRSDDIELDEERYFRAVDRAVTEYHSKPSGLPLVLAALPEHQSTFHQISRNPRLMLSGIETDPGVERAETLRKKAWKVIEPSWNLRVDSLVAEFEEAKSKQRGDDEPEAVSEAAIAGRVSLVLLDSAKELPGRMAGNDGSINVDGLLAGVHHDVLDEIAMIVLKNGGEVLVLPTEKMPTLSGIAAIYRY